MSDKENEKPEDPKDPKIPKVKPQRRNDSPDLLSTLVDRYTPKGGGSPMDSGELIPRKRVFFDVDGAECSPGMFVDDKGDAILFKIGLAGLTSAMEIAVVKGITDPAQAAQLTAKSSIETMNGAPVTGNNLDFLWEALGPGGRQLVLTMYSDIGALSPIGLGKALASCSPQ